MLQKLSQDITSQKKMIIRFFFEKKSIFLNTKWEEAWKFLRFNNRANSKFLTDLQRKNVDEKSIADSRHLLSLE